MNEEFLSIQSAAELLGVSPTTLRRWEEKGVLIPERTFGNQRRYALSVLKAFNKKEYSLIETPLQPESENPSIQHADKISASDQIEKPILQEYLFTSPTNIPVEPFFPQVKNDPLQSGNVTETFTPQDQQAAVLISKAKRKGNFFKNNPKTTAGFLFVACLLLMFTALSFQPGENRNVNQPRNEKSVLGLEAKGRHLIGDVLFSIPALFDEKVTINNQFEVNGKSLFTEDIEVANKNIDLGTGELTASNVIYTITAGANVSISGDPQNPVISANLDIPNAVVTFQGQSGDVTLTEGDGIGLDGLTISNTGVLSLGGETGDVELSAGDGIEIDGTTITNTDTGSAQNIFKEFIVDGSSILAESNSDVFTFEAGTGIVLTADTATKKLTITGNGTGGSSGWTTAGSLISLSNITDNVSIGNNSEVAKLGIIGDTDEIQLLLRGNSTQTTNLFVAENSAGTDLFAINNSGQIVSGSSTITLTTTAGNLDADAISLISSDGAGGNTSGSGLETDSDRLGLLQGCANGQILKWNDGAAAWECSNDSGAAAAVVNIENNDLAIGTSVDTVDFSTDFLVGASPLNEANVSIGDDVINFTELADSLTLDGATGISLGDFDLTLGGSSGIGGVVVAPSAGGKAALIVNKQGLGDIFSASASGATRFTITNSGNLQFSGNTGFLNTITSAATSNQTYTLPDATGTICLSTGNCAGAGTGITGSGTATQLAFFSGGSQNISSDSNLYWDNTSKLLGVGNASPVAKLDVAGNVSGKALTIFNETGNQDILTASASGMTAFTISRNGNITIASTTANSDRLLFAPQSGGAATFTGTVTSQDLTGNQTYTLPDATGTICLTTGNCAGIGGYGDVTAVGSMLSGNAFADNTADDDWLGLGATAGRIEFDDQTVDEINILASKFGIGTQTPDSLLHVTGAITGRSLALFDETGDQDIFTASASGTTRLTLDRSGNLNIVGGAYQINGTSVLNSTTLGANITNSSIQTLGTIGTGIWQASAIGAQYGGTGDNTTGVTGVPYISSGNWLYEASLDETRGGTGLSAYVAGDMLYGSGSNTLARLAAGGSGQILTISGGLPAWADPGGTINFWQRSNGALAPLSVSDDLLLGGTSTASAKFAFTNNTGSGTPTASISANSGNNALYINGTGTIGTTNAQTLQLGSAATGNVSLISGGTTALTAIANGNIGIGTTTPTAKLEVNGSISANGTLLNLTDSATYAFRSTQSTGVITIGGDLDYGYIQSWGNKPLQLNNQGNDVIINALYGNVGIGITTPTAKLDVRGALGTTPIASFSGQTATAGIVVDNRGSGDIFTASSSGTTRLTVSNGGNLNLIGGVYQSGGISGITQGSASCVTTTGGIVTGFGACQLGSEQWIVNNGAIYTGNPSLDLLLGGNATASSKFAFTGVSGGTPTASISAASGNNATFLTGAGNLGTTNAQTLTLGGTSTGDINIAPHGVNLLRLSTQQTSGNVSIGTSPLQDWAELSIGAVAGQNSDILLRDGDGTNTWDLFADIDGSFGVYDVTNGKTPFAIDPNTPTDTLTLNSSGSVGIGNANPTAILDVNGTIAGKALTILNETGGNDIFTASASGATKFTLLNSGTIRMANYTTAGGIFYGTSTGDLALSTAGSGGQCLVSGGTGAPTWTTCSSSTNHWNIANGLLYNGNLTTDFAVGGTSTTSAKFLVSMSGTQPTASVSGLTSHASLIVDNRGSGDLFTASSSGFSRFVIKQNGNVGIGTNIPSAKVDIQGTNSSASEGPSLISGGDFSNEWQGTNWVLTASDGTHTPGDTTDLTLTSPFGSTIGSIYKVIFTVSNIGAGSITASVGGGSGSAISVDGEFVQYLTSVDGGSIAFTPTSDFDGTLSGISAFLITPANALINLRNSNGTVGVELRSGGSGLTNSFIGLNAGRFNVSGANNAGFGANALRGSTGSYNAAFGSESLLGNASGSYNTAVGYQSLLSNINGTYNTALGTRALNSSLFGQANTAVGYNTLYSATGNNNTALGYEAGYGVTGGNNVFIGYQAGRNANTANNKLYIANNSTNTLLYGDFLSGQIGLNTTSPLATLDIRGHSGTQPVSSISGETAKASLIVDNNGVGDLFTASKSGATKFTVLNSGNIRMANYNTAGGVFYGTSTGDLALSTAGTGGQCLVSGGTGAPTWTTCAGGINYWNIANGLLYNGNLTTDFAIGGNSTASAKFLVSMNGTRPTASVSANTSNAGLVVDNRGVGDLFTASKSGATKFVIKNNGNVGIGGTTNPQAALEIADALGTHYIRFKPGAYSGGATSGISTDAWGDDLTFATTQSNGTNNLNQLYLSNVGGVALNAGLTYTIGASLDVKGSTSSPFGGTWAIASVSGQTTKAAIIVDNNGVGDLFAASKSGATKFVIKNNGDLRATNYNTAGGIFYGSTDGTLRITAQGTSGECLQSTGAGGAPTWGSCGSAGSTTNYWELDNGLLYNGNTTTDFAVGGISTTSAKFLVSMSGTRPTASVSANTASAGLIIDNRGVGDLFTASKSGKTHFVVRNSGTVVIGNATDGITLDPQNGGPSYVGNARPTKTISLQPEYSGAVLTAFYGAGTDTNITGNLTSDVETSGSNNLRSYYQWERTTDATQHFYTVAIRVRLPKDFSAWTSSNAIQVDYITESATSTNSDLDVRVYIDNDGSMASTDAESLNNTSTSWSTVSIAGSSLTEVDAADETAVIYLRMGSASSNFVKIGEIKLNYLSRF